MRTASITLLSMLGPISTLALGAGAALVLTGVVVTGVRTRPKSASTAPRPG